TRGDTKLVPDQGKRPCDNQQDLLCHRGGVFVIPQFRQEHHEFVASEASNRVVLAHAGAESARDFLEQLISGLVTESVVDLLESVEVEKHNRQPSFETMGFAD